MKTKIEMFATANDTNKTILAIDGYFGFVTDSEAEECLNIQIDNSCFGSMWIIDPMHTPINVFDKSDMSEGRKISQYRPIDIIDYFQKRQIRAKNRPYKFVNCVDNYKTQKGFEWFFKS